MQIMQTYTTPWYPCKPMQTHGNPCKLMQTHANPLQTHANPCRPMQMQIYANHVNVQTRANLCKPVQTRANPCKPMQTHADPAPMQTDRVYDTLTHRTVYGQQNRAHFEIAPMFPQRYDPWRPYGASLRSGGCWTYVRDLDPRAPWSGIAP